MFLLLDANVMFANPLLRGRQWDSVADAVVSETLEVFVPLLAIEETVARIKDAAAARQRALKKDMRVWPAEARELLKQAIEASQRFADDYETQLRGRLRQMGAEIREYPNVDHQVIAERAITRRAPFDPDGNGYRDALHWHTFLELLEEVEPEDPYAVLLSADRKAFGPHRHDELTAEADRLGYGWNVQFLSTINDFSVPGQFHEEGGGLVASQVRELQEAVERALRYGGWPDDLAGALASRAGFDEAHVAIIESLAFTGVEVRVERKSGDLWVSYDAKATCMIEFESIEIVDEELGEYATNRDSRRWTLALTGAAYSTRETFEDVASLRLDDRGGDPITLEEQVIAQ